MHVVRATSDLHLNSWQSGGKLPGGGRWSFHVTWLRFVGFLQNAGALLFQLSCCLALALCARCFPSFRPDTASIRSCLLFLPGFLDTREAGIFAGSRAWSSSLFPCLVLHLLAVPGGFKQPVRNVSSSDAEIGRFCNYVKLFFLDSSSHFTCLNRARPFILGTLWRARKELRLVAVSVSSMWITIRRTFSRLFRCVVFDCATMYFPFSHYIL